MRSTLPLPAEYRSSLAAPVRASYDVAVTIAEKVASAGGRAYLVGGVVRDMLLGTAAKDFDLEVYGLAPDDLEALCTTVGPVNDVGRSFGVLKVAAEDGPDVDVSIPRTDSKVQPGHRGFAVATNPAMPMAEAVRRRDFTMNAILGDPLTGEIFDPAGGRADLEARILRVVDKETFGEDPLRSLRALQFLARFDLTLDPASADVIRATLPTLRELPPERLYEEWRKLLLKAEQPSSGLRAGHELGIFAVLHPELERLWETPQEPEWHPEGDVGTHTCMAVDVAAFIVRRDAFSEADAWTVLLGTLCHDMGKPATTEVLDGRIRSIKHSEAGMVPAAHFLATINVDFGTRAKVATLVREHLLPGMLWRTEQHGVPVSDGTIRRLAARLAPSNITELAAVAEADVRGRGTTVRDVPLGRAWLLARSTELDAAHGPAPDLLQGRDLLALGLAAGPQFGDIIRRANDLRDDHGTTREEVLAMLDGAASAEEALRRLG